MDYWKASIVLFKRQNEKHGDIETLDTYISMVYATANKLEIVVKPHWLELFLAAYKPISLSWGKRM
jgi:hypothetical protein